MTGFVFCNRYGNIMNAQSVNRAIKRISSAYNATEEVEAKKEHREPVLLPDFSAHSLRHTFCTRLCERETNLKIIQSIMGHKDIQTTMDILSLIHISSSSSIFRRSLVAYEYFQRSSLHYSASLNSNLFLSLFLNYTRDLKLFLLIYCSKISLKKIIKKIYKK